MTPTFALSSHQVALDMYALLNDLDPSRWRDESERLIRERFELLLKKIEALLEQPKNSYAGQIASVRAKLSEVSNVLKEHMPNRSIPSKSRKAQWNQFRIQLLEEYESLAEKLRHFSFAPPELRPTNYSRSLIHVFIASLVFVISYFVIPPSYWIYAMLPITGLAWIVEGWRKRSPKTNDLLLKVLGPIGHPHERSKVNSATWYLTALVLLILADVPPAFHAGLIVLGFADPAAGFFGRKWGRLKITDNRTVLGTGAFWVVGTLASILLFRLFYSEYSWAVALVASAAASSFGAIAEVLSKKVDDNFSIPLAAALGAGLVLHFMV